MQKLRVGSRHGCSVLCQHLVGFLPVTPFTLHFVRSGQLLWREFFYLCGATIPNFGCMHGNPICKQAGARGRCCLLATAKKRGTVWALPAGPMIKFISTTPPFPSIGPLGG